MLDEGGDASMAMSRERRAEQEAKGAVVTTVAGFLGLDTIDEQVVELKVRVAREVRRRSEAAGMSRAALAARLGVSQPRIPKVERPLRIRSYFVSTDDINEDAGVFA